MTVDPFVRFPLGTLFKGNVKSASGSVVNRIIKAPSFFGIPLSEDRRFVRGEEYSFKLLSASTVDVLLSHKRTRGNQVGADIRLFNDFNGNGRFDVGQETTEDVSLLSGSRDEHINRRIPAGNYTIGIVLAGGSSSIRSREADFSLRVEVVEADRLPPPKVRLPNLSNGSLAAKTGGVLNGKNIAGTLVGRNGRDTINANNGNDIVLGGGNNDTLNGGNGNDIIFGGRGNDSLNGGRGNDVFVIAPKNKNGFDTISDFRLGQDRVGLGSGLTLDNLDFVQQAKGTLVKSGNQQLAFFSGVRPNQLSSSTHFAQVELSELTAAANVLLRG